MKKIISLIISISMLCAHFSAFALENGTVSWDERENIYKDYGLEMPYRPVDKDICEQNPPDFSWPYVNIAKSYNLIVCKDEAMTDIAYEKKGITLNVYNFDVVFDIGTYYWSVQFETKDGRFSEWSDVRRFTILPTAVPFIVDSAETMINKLKGIGHPRIAVNKNTIDEFRKLSEGVSKSTYSTLYKTAEKYLEGTIPKEPVCTSTDEAAAMYKEVQTMCGLIRTCAFVYLISGEERFGDFAVTALLEMASWDPEGATAYQWQDQAYREIVVNAAYAYDWTYNLMEEDEKAKVLKMLKVRMKVMAEISIGVTGEEDGTLEKLPYGSHNWTAFGYLLISAIATLGEVEEAETYLTKGLPFYINVMAPWGGEDGGWSQGTGYWAASMTRHHDLNYTLKINDIINIYEKAFFRNHINYAIYNTGKNGGAPFGDGASGNVTSDMQLVIKALSSMANSEYAKWYYDYIGIGATNIYEKYFIEDDSNIVKKAPVYLPKAHLFSDIGWTAHHSELVDDNKISLFFKSSPYGSYNHSHADQNSFVIYAYGEPLAIDSGYYDSYWSEFDLGYTRKTYAHNAITYDGGKGQPIHSKNASGEIVNFITHPDFDLVSGDATNAYTDKTKESTINDERVLDKVLRHIIYVRPDMFIVIDDLKAKGDAESKFEWWLNAYEDIKFTDDKTGAIITKNNVQLDAEIVYPSDMKKGELITTFSGPDKVEYTPGGIYADSQVHKRVWFETPSLNKTKIVSTMGVHLSDGNSKDIKTTKKENNLEIQCEDGTYIYVNLDDNKEVILEDGTKFKGAALLVKDTSVMLVDGTYLYMDGKDVISSDKNVSVAFGKDELEISSYEDANIKLNIGKINHIKDAKGNEIEENDSSYGINWKFNENVLSLDILKNNYSLYLNNKPLPGTDTNVTIDNTFKMTGEDGIDYIYHFGRFDFSDKNLPEDAGIIINNVKYSLIKNNENTQFDKALSVKRFGIGIFDKNNTLGDRYNVIPYMTINDSDIFGVETSVVKSEKKSKNANLKSLSASDGAEIYPKISEDVSEYYVAYPEGELPDVQPDISYTLESLNATATKETDTDKTTITVTAEDGTKKT